MTSSPREIQVKCLCEHVYNVRHCPSINPPLEEFDDEYLEKESAYTCPNCGLKMRHQALTVRKDGIWDFNGDGLPEDSILYLPVDLGTEDEQSFVDAVKAFPEELAKPPVGLKITVSRMSDSKSLEIVRQLERPNIMETTSQLMTAFFIEDVGYRRIVIGCPNTHAIAERVKTNNEIAVWGGCVHQVAITYNCANKYLIWHEMLHLLGAEECYDKKNLSGGTTCDNKGCIMQYAPSEQTISDWPFLCDKTQAIVQKQGHPYGADDC